jgi:hypothetical protein|tara:strand:+ start:1674 stop:2717 length:1044 start_codon:yes stop_codon:yes gene_type:complete
MSASVDQQFETFVEETLEEKAPTDGAKGADPMVAATIPGPQDTAKDNLGGPTNQNYKQDNDSSKIANKGTSKVSDVNTKSAKPGDAAPGKLKEEEESTEEVVSETTEVTEEEFSVEEDVNALLTGEELSEEFKEKTKTIFEAAVKSKLAEETKKIEESFEVRLTEQVDTVKTELAEKMDKFLTYVAEEWKKENELELHNGIKLEMMQSFMDGMKNLFEENYVQLPEEKYDVMQEMTDKLDEMEAKLNEQIETNMSLNGKVNSFVKESIVTEVSKGLADTQAEKFSSLAEGVEFESEESFKEKLETIKESYFPKAKVELKEDIATDEVASPVEGSMSAYVNAISRYGK